MSNDYEIGQRSIGALFDDGHTYKIPAYQRKYAWDRDHAEQLFDDVIEMADNNEMSNSNILGAMVVVNRRGEFEFEVVDGQQRLATLSMMFCSLRISLLKFKSDINRTDPNLENVLQKLDNLVKVKKSDRNVCVRMELGDVDSAVFREILYNEDPDYRKFCKNVTEKNESGKKRIKESHELMLNNYISLCEKAEKWVGGFGLEEAENNNDVNKLSLAIISLMDHIINITKYNKFAFINVPNTYLAYKIFSKFNSQGQKLNQADLIKSHLLSILTDSSTRNSVESGWREIFNEDLDDPDKFLYESMSSRHPSGSINGIKVTQENLYRIVHSQAKSPDDARMWLEEFKEDSKLIKFMDHPEDLYSGSKYEKIKSDFYGMKALNARYIRVPILAASRRWRHDEKELQEIVDCLLIFFFKFKFINDGTAEDVRAVANEVTRLLRNEEPISKIISQILVNKDAPGGSSKRISNTVFEENFKKKMYKVQTCVAKYVLASIEMLLRERSNKETNRYIEYDFELEHVLPTRHKAWPSKKFLDAKGTDDDIDKYKNRLGNLTILSAKWNRGLGAKPFLEKRKHKNGYKNSDFLINGYLARCEDWTATSVIRREEHLASYAKDVWSLDKYDKYLKLYGHMDDG